MLIDTLRFGPLEVDGERIVTFESGLLGFTQHRRFALVQTSADPVFFWLQSVEDAGLAFVVCDPAVFVPDYQVPVRRDDLTALGCSDLNECQVLVVVNKVDGHLTANLLGPLVIGTRSLLARQMVLSDRRYGTRHRLMPVPSQRQVALTA
jgi:flagellar assembly factor FliW